MRENPLGYIGTALLMLALVVVIVVQLVAPVVAR